MQACDDSLSKKMHDQFLGGLSVWEPSKHRTFGLEGILEPDRICWRQQLGTSSN
jgi:hypothetical protein